MLKIQNKLFGALLILVFIVSVSAVVAEDTADATDLAINDVDDAIAVTDGNDGSVAQEDAGDVVEAPANDGPVVAEENQNVDLESSDADEPVDVDDVVETPAKSKAVLSANSQSGTVESDDDDSNLTSLAILIDVLDKNPKVGDKFRVKITVKNWGDHSADNVQAGFSFTDLQENVDTSFKLADDGGYAVTMADGGYVVDFGFIGAGDTQDVILTFVATEAGTKNIVCNVVSDDSIMEPDSDNNATITVVEDSADSAASADNAKAKDKASGVKNLPATGNPLALLAIALFCLIPCYRRR